MKSNWIKYSIILILYFRVNSWKNFSILRTKRKVIKDTCSEITSSRVIHVSVKANLSQIKQFSFLYNSNIFLILTILMQFHKINSKVMLITFPQNIPSSKHTLKIFLIFSLMFRQMLLHTYYFLFYVKNEIKEHEWPITIEVYYICQVLIFSYIYIS